MAQSHFRPARWLVLAAAAACAAAAPFPHSVHLSQGLDCTFCHSAALKSTAPNDDLLPRREVCLNCHEAPVLPVHRPDTGLARLARFSHALHLKMGDVAPFLAAAIDKRNYLHPDPRITAWVRSRLNRGNVCEACHRGLEDSEQVTKAALPLMADCLVCHTQIDAPFSCEDCHIKNAPLKPTSHTEHFVDAHSSGKVHLDKSTCAECHGRQFTCMGCH